MRLIGFAVAFGHGPLDQERRPEDGRLDDREPDRLNARLCPDVGCGDRRCACPKQDERAAPGEQFRTSQHDRSVARKRGRGAAGRFLRGARARAYSSLEILKWE
jgi:hypothetical protein